uniref:Myb-like domain-containing protein n=1 Tax=Romanomermis culicivorax TaxID=13658 RepID=A0A915JPA7_ROMCU
MSRRLRLSAKPNLNLKAAVYEPKAVTSTLEAVVKSDADTSPEEQQTQQPPTQPSTSPTNVSKPEVLDVTNEVPEKGILPNAQKTSDNTKALSDVIRSSKTVPASDLTVEIVSEQLINSKEVEDTEVEKTVVVSELIEEKPHSKTTVDVNIDNFEKNELSAKKTSPILKALLSSPSKYRHRLQIKPNIPSSMQEQKTGADELTVATDDELRAKKLPKRFNNKDELNRSVFTMKDLIYWNPDNGTSIKYDEENPEADTLMYQDNKEKTSAITIEAKPKKDKKDISAPQVRVNADGSLVIDEESLVIEQTREDVVFETVRESQKNRAYKLNIQSFRRKPILRSKLWTEKETNKFYRVLRMTGTDFSLMTEYFPHRCRISLKNKFNREARYNPSRIAQVMAPSPSEVRIKKPKLLRKIDGEIDDAKESSQLVIVTKKDIRNKENLSVNAKTIQRDPYPDDIVEESWVPYRPKLKRHKNQLSSDSESDDEEKASTPKKTILVIPPTKDDKKSSVLPVVDDNAA